MVVLIPCNAKGAFPAIARAMVYVAGSRSAEALPGAPGRSRMPWWQQWAGPSAKLLREGSPDHLDQFHVSSKGTMSPRRASGIPKRATSAATRKSQCRAISQPPASASPCTIAMVG